ncbi:MAG: hypothetical protein RIQ94_372 [Pseudomonadota bacterium]|jgi:hypothetical protein
MIQHRSISQRLKRAKSPEAKHLTLDEWAKSWELEQMQVIASLGVAIKDGDFDRECILCGELKALSIKKFEALPKVLNTLIDATIFE